MLDMDHCTKMKMKKAQLDKGKDLWGVFVSLPRV